ncbi:GNAT family N-acetyltransferase [Fictibacillus fluitans]|uniref:GNAT family N-acetyltransferase n=1 Tax=Fictibacillus fluitans TaxID=3058422 RepID=A0ABT8HUN0_9BACL|nr:GNAT family N-acetyltransferase [Fictibacillus sp. NE201]MDN4524473.1 GNAT family N-acetyltransferase [Fictibacillus sp. NE201]
MGTFTIVKPEVSENVVASQAVAAETGEIMGLLVRTAQWLQSKGSLQWNELLEGKDVHGMAQSITDGDVFVFKKEGRVVGVVMLPQDAREWDLDLWGSDQPEAIYLHRLAIDRGAAGKNLGKDILNWVTEGIIFEGKTMIRLDCIATNESLNTFYREAGFTYRGTSDSGFNIYDKPKK